MGLFRLILALAVINTHMPHPIPTVLDGYEAVELFFIISGFYMALILNKKYQNVFLFYSNRFLRLYPAYALVLLASIAWFLIIWVYTKQRPPPFWIARAATEMPTWQWFTIQFSNLTMIGLDIPALLHWKSGAGFSFMSGPADSLPDGAEWGGWLPQVGLQAWSIGSEIWFYLLAPFIVCRGVAIQLSVLVASLAVSMALRDHPLAHFFFPAILWLFVAGSLMFQLQLRVALPESAGWIAIVIILFGCLTVSGLENNTLHTTVLILMAACVPFLFRSFAKQKIDNMIGNLSYAVYLVHLLVINVLQVVFKSHSLPLSASLSVAASVMIMIFIENPIDKYRQRRVAAGTGKRHCVTSVNTGALATGQRGVLVNEGARPLD
jgi:peptidoglycan/LPS O-acetylase OafA/YrhL